MPSLAGLRPGSWLEPPGPRHDTADYAARAAGIGHIRATPGCGRASRPHQISLARTYPARGQGPGHPEAGGWHAAVRSWVRADHAALDPVLCHAARAWLDRAWLLRSTAYAPRE